MLPEMLTPHAKRTFPWHPYEPRHGAKESYQCTPICTEIPINWDSNVRLVIRATDRAEWQLRKGAEVKFHGNTDTIENAALEAIHKFYSLVTESKFNEARLPRVGRKIAIAGTRVRPAEFYTASKLLIQKCTVIGVDDREDTIFVVGWPKGPKEDFITTIQKLKAGRGFTIPNIFNSHITTAEGTEIYESMDWRMYNVHENVDGEVYCQMCRNLWTSTSEMVMRYVQTLGPLCGLCTDHMQIDQEYCLDGLIDV